MMTMNPMIPALHRLSAGLGGLIFAVGLGAGCEPTDDANSAGEATTGEATTGEATTAATTGESDAEETETETEGETSPAADPAPNPFDLHREQVRLLPFAVRLNRLALLVDRPTSDPIFSELRARRYELGDYDYSEGINPDLTWSSSRIANWVAGLRPFCRSAVFKERYPEFPLDLAELMHDAYGYAPSADEIATFASLFDDLEEPAPADPDGTVEGANEDNPLSLEALHETTCLAVLSSLEFVAL